MSLSTSETNFSISLFRTCIFFGSRNPKVLLQLHRASKKESGKSLVGKEVQNKHIPKSESFASPEKRDNKSVVGSPAMKGDMYSDTFLLFPMRNIKTHRLLYVLMRSFGFPLRYLSCSEFFRPSKCKRTSKESWSTFLSLQETELSMRQKAASSESFGRQRRVQSSMYKNLNKFFMMKRRFIGRRHTESR